MNPQEPINNPVDSPHFRPAFNDLTNEPVALESPGQVAKKRKSFGRRVSFAAKAKVRFIEEEEGAGGIERGTDDNGNEENEDDNDIFARPKVIPDFVLDGGNTSESPMRPIGKYHQKARININESPSCLSIISNESIEVELRDPHSSFSSYDSEIDGGVDIANTINGKNSSMIDDNTMDITNCVGGIISAATVTCTTINTNDANTMDLTTCIGGILGGQSIMTTTNSHHHHLNSDNDMEKDNNSDISMGSPSSIDTMELTSVVGGILKNRQQQLRVNSDDPASPITYIPKSKLNQMIVDGEEQQEEGEGEGEEEEDDDGDQTMEMTRVVSNNIKAPLMGMTNNLLQSPSPFLVGSPKRRSSISSGNGGGGGITMIQSPLQSELSFIGDLNADSLVKGTSPATPRTINNVTIAETVNGMMVDDNTMDLTTELFNKYIDTNRLRAMTSGPVEDEQQNTIMMPTTPILVSQNSNSIVTTNTVNALPPSQVESPTVTLILPRASLKDFLNETGVRFLDNLSSLNRRETTGRPRESELVSVGKQLMVDGGIFVECDTLDTACEHLSQMIAIQRDELSRQEEQFNHSPPLPYLEYRDPSERSIVISKLKTLKSIARLYSKQAWYEWRSAIHNDLNDKLEINVKLAEERSSKLDRMNTQLDEMISNLEPAVISINEQVNMARERFEQAQADDVETAEQLEKLAMFQQTKITQVDTEMAALMAKEVELRQAVEQMATRRQELQHLLGVLRQQVDSIPDSSPMVLEELRSSLELLQGVVGWKVEKISVNDITLIHIKSLVKIRISLTTDNGGNGSSSSIKAESIAFNIDSVKSRLLRHIPRIVKLSQSPMGVAETLLVVGQRLDRFVHMDKQIAIVSVQCQVGIPEYVEVESPSFIPITLRFLHGATKFDVLLTFDGDQVIYAGFVHFYGPIGEAQLVDQVQLALLNNKHQPIRKTVNSIIETIDSLQ